MRLRDIADMRRGADDRMHQTRIGIDANVRLHTEVPFIILFDLMHFRIALAALIVRRRGRSDQRGIDHRAFLKQQAGLGQVGVDHLKKLLGQSVFFEQVAKAQDADAIRQTAHAGQAGKLAVQGLLEQRFLHCQIRQTELLLQKVKSQHGLQRKRWASGLFTRRQWCNQCQQRRPRHGLLHGLEKFALTRAALRQVQRQGDLLHRATPLQRRKPRLSATTAASAARCGEF